LSELSLSEISLSKTRVLALWQSIFGQNTSTLYGLI